MQLDPWQEEILNYHGNVLLCTGRQVGKTTIFARKAAEYMIKHKGSKIIIISLTEDQSKLIIVMILSYLEQNYKKHIASGKQKPTLNRVILKNGSQALARPVGATGDAVRGFTADVLIIDEASRMPELAFQSAKPVLMTTAGQIWICSTPFGKKGYFYECFLNKDNRFKVWHISSEEVVKNRPISESWTEEQRKQVLEFLESEKKHQSKTYYGQEFLGLFLDDLNQFFEDELLNKCCILKRPETISREGVTATGHDLARMGGDQWTAETLQRKNPESVIKQIESKAKKNLTTTENEQLIIEHDKIYNADKIGIDAGSGTIGVSILDHLKKTDIGFKIVPMNNREIVVDRKNNKKMVLKKELFYYNLKAMMERGEIQLLDDEEIRLSLKSVQLEVNTEDTTIGQVRIFGNFTHHAEGIVRAAWLIKETKGLNFGIYYI